MEIKEFKKYNETVRNKGIVMSRIPSDTREIFVSLADDCFCGDYGLSLKWFVDQTLEYQKLKEALLDKETLDSIINLVNNKKLKEEKPEGKKMLNGRTV